MAASCLLEAVKAAVDLFEQLAGCLVGTVVFVSVCEAKGRFLGLEELTLFLHETPEQAGLSRIGGRDPQGVGHEGEASSLLFVLGNKPQEYSLFERAPQVDVTDLRVQLLSVA